MYLIFFFCVIGLGMHGREMDYQMQCHGSRHLGPVGERSQRNNELWAVGQEEEAEA